MWKCFKHNFNLRKGNVVAVSSQSSNDSCNLNSKGPGLQSNERKKCQKYEERCHEICMNSPIFRCAYRNDINAVACIICDFVFVKATDRGWLCFVTVSNFLNLSRQVSVTSSSSIKRNKSLWYRWARECQCCTRCRKHFFDLGGRVLGEYVHAQTK